MIEPHIDPKDIKECFGKLNNTYSVSECENKCKYLGVCTRATMAVFEEWWKEHGNG